MKAILVSVDREPAELAAYMVIPRPFVATADLYREVAGRYRAEVEAGLTILVIDRDRRIRHLGSDDPNARLSRTREEILRTLDRLTVPR